VNGYVGESRTKIGIVARVSGLHRIQSLGFESLDTGTGTPFLEMRHRDQATRGVDHIGNRSERRQRLFHESRSPPPDETVEGVARIYGPAVTNDCPSHVRTSNGTAGGFLQHAFERQIYPQPLKLVNHLPGSSNAICPAVLQESFQLGRAGWKEVPQHMHFTPRCGGRELASRHHAYPVALAGGQRFGYAAEGIMIGECDGVKARGKGPSDYSFRSNTSVRGSRMDMQVDDLRPAVVCSGIQRRYPVSGAVQEGWE
jgi:hypothetical protein